MKQIIKKIYKLFLFLFFRPMYHNLYEPNGITFRGIFFQKILGFNRCVPWPVHFTSRVTGVKNIEIGIRTMPGASPGCYIQGIGRIVLGNYIYIAPQVAIISANHDVYDLRKHLIESVYIGSYSWIGFGAVILPGVELGDFTIVGANSVVTKSFPEGYCVIAGNPARKIKDLDPMKCIRYENKYKYKGFKRVK